MQINKLAKMIRESAGRFFRVTFIKRTNGELREMTARLGVSKGVTGEGLKFNPRSRDLMVAWDVTKNGHRMINLRGLRSFKCGSKQWRAAA